MGAAMRDIEAFKIEFYEDLLAQEIWREEKGTRINECPLKPYSKKPRYKDDLIDLEYKH